MAALDALDVANSIEVLITGADFAPHKPNGIALARMALQRRPRMRVLFMARSDLILFTEGLGEFLEDPVEIADVVQAVKRILPNEPGDASKGSAT
jgi:hypothetical protein